MTKFYSDAQTVVNGPAFGQPLQTRLKSNRLCGRVRYAEFSYVAPQTGTPQIGDTIVFGKLPVKARVLGFLSQLRWSTGTASCTLALGDNQVAARHLAATAITTAGTATPDAAGMAPTAVATTTTGSPILTAITGLGAFQLGDLVTGTGVASGSYVIGIAPGSTQATSTVTLSQNCTASASVTVTSTGSSFETYEDSNSVGNAFGSATDDCTLVGTVAGAAVAAGQAILLKVAYTQD
jgi:hypothetical protein